MMNRRLILWSGAGTVGVAGALFGAWLLSLPAATIIGVCARAKIVAEAGLLDGKRATTHWYFVEELRNAHPSIRYVPDRRVVVDRGVATTTGITTSIPTALTVIEAITGREKAGAVAREIGLAHWDARHKSDAFQFTRPLALTALVNAAAFWRREQLGIELTPGLDEVSVALVPDRVTASWPADDRLPAIGNRQPARALDEALDAIQARYGARTAYFVAMQLEYPDRVNTTLPTAAEPNPGKHHTYLALP